MTEKIIYLDTPRPDRIDNDTIRVEFDYPTTGGGSISTTLKADEEENADAYNHAIDGVESLILAHACAGVDITAPAYVAGIKQAVNAISDNLMP